MVIGKEKIDSAENERNKGIGQVDEVGSGREIYWHTATTKNDSNMHLWPMNFIVIIGLRRILDTECGSMISMLHR